MNELPPALAMNELPPALAGGPRINILKGFSQNIVNCLIYHYLQNFG
jgi:hypothetical protein